MDIRRICWKFYTWRVDRVHGQIGHFVVLATIAQRHNYGNDGCCLHKLEAYLILNPSLSIMFHA